MVSVMGAAPAGRTSPLARRQNGRAFPTMMYRCESDNRCSWRFIATYCQRERCYRSQPGCTWRGPLLGVWLRTTAEHKPAAARGFKVDVSRYFGETTIIIPPPKRLRMPVSTRNDCLINEQRNEMYTKGAILRMSGRRRESEATRSGWRGIFKKNNKKRSYLFT